MANFPSASVTADAASRLAVQLALGGPVVMSYTDRLNDGKFRVYTMLRRSSDLTLRINGERENGTRVAAGVNLDALGSPLLIGGEPGQPLQGDIAEIVALRGDFSDEELSALERHLMTKYALGQVLPDGLITNVPYTCSSPFDGVDFRSYFYLEDWEDNVLDTPGVISDSSILSSSFGYPPSIDSVDCDDGLDDGTCLDCNALFANSSVELTFDAQALGDLPTHVGVVWTDGGAGTSVTFTSYDALDAVISGKTVDNVGDGTNHNTTDEDRFFGIVHYSGVKRVVLANSSGGIEIDHLQYGR